MPTSRASAIIPAPVDQVWQLIREFGSYRAWVAAVETVEFSNGTATTVGVVQRIRFADGTTREEKLTELDDANHSLSYWSIGERPPPAFNLVGHIRLSSVTADNSTFIERVVQFDCELSKDEGAKFAASISASLADSLARLKTLFGACACSS